MFPLWWQLFSQQSTQTLARRQSSAGWSLRSIHFACQTNLTGVPSQCQYRERIKTVKMATVTGSWQSRHLGMMSTFDILRPCPKIIIPQLDSIASRCSPWLWISWTTHLFSNLHLTFISISPCLSLSGFSSSFFPFTLSLSSAINPPCSSWLNQATSATATILLSFLYFSLTLYSLSLLLFPSICLYVSSFSLLSTCSCHLLL